MSGKGNETEPLIPEWLRPDAQPKMREDFARNRAHNDRITGGRVLGNSFVNTPQEFIMPGVMPKK
jgi:hypothetical protein